MTAKKTTTKSTKTKPTTGLRRHLRSADLIIGIIATSLIGFGVWHNVSSADSARTAASGDSCAQVGREHQVTIQDDAFTPAAINVNRCDRIVIANHDSTTYDLMLGETMDSHAAYPGFDGQLLKPGQFFVFDAFKTGSYPLADHSRNQAVLQITINE